MTEVKRYDISGYDGEMIESDHGAWYHMDDYDALRAENERLKRELGIVGEVANGALRERDQLRAELQALKGGAVQDPASAAIEYVLAHVCEEPIEFLRRWNEGDFQALRSDWPDVPDEVFAGADPLHPATIFMLAAAPQPAEKAQHAEGIYAADPLACSGCASGCFRCLTGSKQAERQELAGEAGHMPGTSGFTMAAFEAAKVPVGTKLYTAPQPAQDVSGLVRLLGECQEVLSRARTPHAEEIWRKIGIRLAAHRAKEVGES